jgi:hypothetical protein
VYIPNTKTNTSVVFRTDCWMLLWGFRLAGAENQVRRAQEQLGGAFASIQIYFSSFLLLNSLFEKVHL